MQDSREKIITELFESISALKRVMAACLHVTDVGCPLPRAQADILIAIRQLQPVSSKDLATHLLLTAGAISQSVEGLESHSLLVRQIDPTDRRKQMLRLSEKGEELIIGLDKRRHKLLESIFEELSDEELRLWLRIQHKTYKQLQITYTKKDK